MDFNDYINQLGQLNKQDAEVELNNFYTFNSGLLHFFKAIDDQFISLLQSPNLNSISVGTIINEVNKIIPDLNNLKFEISMFDEIMLSNTYRNDVLKTIKYIKDMMVISEVKFMKERFINLLKDNELKYRSEQIENNNKKKEEQESQKKKEQELLENEQREQERNRILEERKLREQLEEQKREEQSKLDKERIENERIRIEEQQKQKEQQEMQERFRLEQIRIEAEAKEKQDFENERIRLEEQQKQKEQQERQERFRLEQIRIEAEARENLRVEEERKKIEKEKKEKLELERKRKEVEERKKFENGSILFDPITKGEILKVRELINEGANVNGLTAGHFPAIYWAIQYDKPEIVDLLIKSGADVNILYQQEPVLLIRSIEKNNENILRALINAGAFIGIHEKSYGHHFSILDWCVRVRPSSKGIIKLLVESGAKSINSTPFFDKDGNVKFRSDFKNR